MKKPTNTTEQVQRDPMTFLAESALFGSHAIERQESRGQAEFVGSDTLPTDGNKAALEAAGVKFGMPVEGDPMFQYVELPEGWRKERTDHAMWSNLFDAKGRKRASIFYKAAFYDRSAHFHCDTRFTVRKDYDLKNMAVARVFDGELPIYATKPLAYPEGNERGAWLKRGELDYAAVKEATAWLEAKYPDWRNAAAYWE